MKLRSLVVRQWRNRLGRTLAAIASVAVAVAAIVATWAAADASRAGYRQLASATGGGPVIDIVARDGGRFDAQTVPRLVDLPGVRAVVPLFFRPTLLRVGEKRVREIAVGVDVESLVDLGILTLVAGEPCVADDEVVLDAELAASLGKQVGDEVLMFARRGIRRMKVTGLAETRALRGFAEGASVVLDIAVLGDMSAAGSRIDRVRVVLQPSAPRADVLRLAGERLPATLVAEVPAVSGGMAEDVLHSANLGLDFVTGLTAAMAWFIVGNAMLMSVTERRRGLTMMRLLGATGRQIRRLITGEAAVLGGTGAVVGAALGLAAAIPIAAGISRALQLPSTSLVVNPFVVPLAILGGVLVAIAAAWWPAREASDADLLAGLAGAPGRASRTTSWRAVAAVLVLATFAAGVQLLVLAERLPPRAAVAGGIALLLAFVAVTPLLLPPLARLLVRCLPGRWRTESTLALAQILRQPVRTVLTTGVLVVAVTNGVGLGHAIRDSVADVRGWYDRMLRADWVLTSAGAAAAGQAAELRAAEAEVRALPGVKSAEGIGVAAGRLAGTACVIVARDLASGEPLPLKPVDATEDFVRRALDRGEAVAGTVLARRTQLEPGAEVTVEVFGRSKKLRVAALVVDYTSGGSSLILRRDAAARLFGMEAANILLVTATAGQAAALHDPLASIAGSHAMLLRSFADFRKFIDAIVDGVVGSLWTILGLGFIVGSLGVANTVTMNVLEQRRGLGLLRAVGMTRGQVTRMVVLQSTILGAAGGVIGAVGGIVTALFIQLASQPLLGHPLAFSLRPGIIVANLAAALAVTAVVAWLPARRAARLDLLEAIAAE